MSYVSPKKASQIYKVSEQTLRRWADNGEIHTIKTSGGHRRYRITKGTDKRQSFIYARVSSSKQREDLERQIKLLSKLYPTHTVIRDIGSGINFKRKGFRTLLEQVFEGNVNEIVVAFRDRFTRFGYELFEWIFQEFGTTIVAINDEEDRSPQEELAEDLLAITTVFSARYYGGRKYQVL